MSNDQRLPKPAVSVPFRIMHALYLATIEVDVKSLELVDGARDRVAISIEFLRDWAEINGISADHGESLVCESRRGAGVDTHSADY